jgi:hypothetical protein
MGRNHRITDWNPEDRAAWEAGNKIIARRNLLCTMAGDHAAFSIWSLWSVMALFMPASVYGFSAGDKLLLGAVATLVGGFARIPYTLGIAAFGGRNWTTFSAFVLLIASPRSLPGRYTFAARCRPRACREPCSRPSQPGCDRGRSAGNAPAIAW